MNSELKEGFKGFLFMLYCMAACFILGVAMFTPMIYGGDYKDKPPLWLLAIILPLAAIVIITQGVCIKYFTTDSENKK